MNNFEERCFAFLTDMLTNRPKDSDGKTVLFTRFIGKPFSIPVTVAEFLL